MLRFVEKEAAQLQVIRRKRSGAMRGTMAYNRFYCKYHIMLLLWQF